MLGAQQRVQQTLIKKTDKELTVAYHGHRQTTAFGWRGSDESTDELLRDWSEAGERAVCPTEVRWRFSSSSTRSSSGHFLGAFAVAAVTPSTLHDASLLSQEIDGVIFPHGNLIIFSMIFTCYHQVMSMQAWHGQVWSK